MMIYNNRGSIWFYSLLKIPFSTPQKLSCRARHLRLCVLVVFSVYGLADTISRISLGSHLSEACQVSTNPAPTGHSSSRLSAVSCHTLHSWHCSNLPRVERCVLFVINCHYIVKHSNDERSNFEMNFI